MKIEAYCSMCGKMKSDELNVYKQSELKPKHLKLELEKRGWIVQFNGDNIDTYCSKECAK